jgi:arylsulfatase A-like enzyme
MLPGPASRGQTAATKDRPNILFIMTDDHASHAMCCYGSKVNQTPNLARIAKEGMRFTNSFCTNSICAPCRAVILTGKYSHLNGLIDNSVTFDGSQQTFPKLLQKAGYATAMIGKWHLKSDPTGFDYWNILPGQGVYYNPATIERRAAEASATSRTSDRSGLGWLKPGRRQAVLSDVPPHGPHRIGSRDRSIGSVRGRADSRAGHLFDDYEGRPGAKTT